DFMEGQARLRSKVSAALAYPILMLIIGSVLITVMMVAVVPKITSIFTSLDRALPWYTATLIFVSKTLSSPEMGGFILMLVTMVMVRKALAGPPPEPGAAAGAPPKKGGVSGWAIGAVLFGFIDVACAFWVESTVEYIIGLVIGLVAGFILARFLVFVATPAGKLWKDGFILRLPIFGSLFRMLAVARFSRTLATLLQSGVPLLKAMDIVRNVLGNARLEKVI